MPEPVSLPRVRALDGIRGAAIAGVLLFHGGRLRGGYLGVDLFFVLSGFLITSLLLVESDATRRIALGRFWSRRARRLLPALFLVLVGVSAYAAFVADPVDLDRIRGDAFATIGYVANWRFVLRGFDYWALFSDPSPLAHTWSISIEEQFYVVWPLVVVGLLGIVARRAGSRPQSVAHLVLAVSIAGAAVSALVMAMLYRVDGDSVRVYYGTDTRAQSILIGAALAAGIAARGPLRGVASRRALEGAAFVGVGLLAVMWSRLEGTSPVLYRGGLTLSALAGAVVIAAVAHPAVGPLGRLLGFRPLVGLGLISYGVYLWHWPIYVWLDADRVGLVGWALLGVRVAATLVVAVISYRYVEQPIRHGAISARSLRVLTPAAVVALGVVVIASTAGSETRLAGVEHRSATEASTEANRNPERLRLMVVGNSVGAFLAQDGFARLSGSTAPILLDSTQVACVFPPTPIVRIPSEPDGVELPDCRASWASALDEFDPEVVLALFNDVGTFGFRRDGEWIEPCSAQFASWYRDELDAAATRLGARGARVVFTTSAYQLSEYDSPEVRRQAECANEVLREFGADSPNADVVDLAKFVCPTIDECRTEIDDVELREDGVHFQGAGARYIARWLLDQISQIAADPGDETIVSGEDSQ